MDETRRKVLASSAISGLVLGTAGCLSQDIFGDQDPNFDFSGNVSTDEPLVENAELSTQAAYPNHYSALIGSDDDADAIRWEYIRQEVTQIVDILEETDYDSEYLVFFGMALPGTKHLQSGPTSSEDGTLRFGYRVDDKRSGTSELVVNTQIGRVESDDVPDDVEFEVRF
jgi:hypothetical protein